MMKAAPGADQRGPLTDSNIAAGPPLLEVDRLCVDFRLRGVDLKAITNVSFTVESGETVVVLGESGSGKSVTAMAIMGLLPTPPARVTHGHIRFEGVDLLALPARARRSYRGPKMAMIFQDALSALNPVLSVGFQISEIIRQHTDLDRRQARGRAVELMDRVRIPAAKDRYGDYPHQFSGGMRQRVVIAMAIALNPAVLIADEPTTALDVTIQAQIMDLLAELRAEHRMGLILITHDLGVTAEVADRIVVLYAGRVVEIASSAELYQAPGHPYTAGLLASIPSIADKGRDLQPIRGTPPNLASIPSGCAFRTRCPYTRQRCVDEVPALREIPGGRMTACHFWAEVTDAGR